MDAFGGNDEESAEVRKLNEEVVSLVYSPILIIQPVFTFLLLCRFKTRTISKNGKS